MGALSILEAFGHVRIYNQGKQLCMNVFCWLETSLRLLEKRHVFL